MNLYDLRRGVLLSQLVLQPSGEAGLLSQALLCSGGTALLGTADHELGVFGLYRWDYLQDRLDSAQGIQRTTLAALRQEHDDQAAAIARRHGIRVSLRQAGASFRNGAYQGTVLEDEPQLGVALDALEAFLDSLPGGLLREALVPPYDRLGIYLCGEILPKDAEGISRPSGLSSHDGTLRFIALNAGDYALARNLAHEFMHVLEDRLWQQAEAAGNSLISRWERLSPGEEAGCGYAFSYRGADGAEWPESGCTSEGEGAADDPEGVWCIDAYSRTFPLEDRARLFEYLFTAGRKPPGCSASPGCGARRAISARPCARPSPACRRSRRPSGSGTCPPWTGRPWRACCGNGGKARPSRWAEPAVRVPCQGRTPVLQCARCPSGNPVPVAQQDRAFAS